MPGRTEGAAARYSEKAIHRSDHPGHGKQRELHAQCGPQLPDLRQRGRITAAQIAEVAEEIFSERNLSMLLYK